FPIREMRPPETTTVASGCGAAPVQSITVTSRITIAAGSLRARSGEAAPRSSTARTSLPGRVIRQGLRTNAPKVTARLDAAHDPVRRERREERLPVRLRRDARVEHGEDAAVGAAAEQAAEPLLQLEDGERHLVFREGIAALVADPVDARGD